MNPKPPNTLRNLGGGRSAPPRTLETAKGAAPDRVMEMCVLWSPACRCMCHKYTLVKHAFGRGLLVGAHICTTYITYHPMHIAHWTVAPVSTGQSHIFTNHICNVCIKCYMIGYFMNHKFHSSAMLTSSLLSGITSSQSTRAQSTSDQRELTERVGR